MCDDCHRTEAKDFWRASVSEKILKLNHFNSFYSNLNKKL